MDCLFIGHNDGDYLDTYQLISSMGEKSGAYRDLNLAQFEYNGKSYRAMDILNYFYNDEKDGVNEKTFYNGDYLSLTIAYLATVVNKHGFTFDYVNTFHLNKKRLKDMLLNDNIMTIIIPTTLYVNAQPIAQIIEFIKKYNNKAKIIVGGPYVLNNITDYQSTDVPPIFEYMDADFYVYNPEGEQALLNILNSLRSRNSFEGIDNIIYNTKNGYKRNKFSKEDNNLKENPINWELFDFNDIGEIIAMRTAKSCPFACSFCGFPIRAGNYKYLEVDDVERELDKIKSLGRVTAINFIDDTFNVPPERFKAILKMMIKNKYGFKWNSFFRCQFADEEMISLMKESGCEGVYLGIESGSDIILKNMNKSAKIDQYRNGIQLLNKYNIISHASFIIGFPGETDDTVEETIRFIEETKPTFFRTQLWFCDRITPIYKEKQKYKLEGCNFQWSHMNMNYERACDWIDYIFLNVKNSIWMPQNSFDYLSVYYLQRKNFTFEEVRDFIITFNNTIKEKLINSSGTYADVEPIKNKVIQIKNRINERT